jgi:hypothetical protein
VKKAPDKRLNRLWASLLILPLAILGFASYVTLAIYSAQSSGSGNLPGVVDLRSYFQKGTGTQTDPYVISRPLHFYNLSRLQNLGVFDSSSYFTLGYDPREGHQDDPYGVAEGTELKFYPNNASTSTSDMVPYLNMGDQDPVLPIGSEASPFYGVFQGNGKEIRNLRVKSGPEDVGVFGYTYSGSKVLNTYFKDLTITDDGYESAITPLPLLYGDNPDVTLGDSSVSYVLHDSTVEFGTSKKTAVKITDLTGQFVPTYPGNLPTTVGTTFRASSEYFHMNDTGGIEVNRDSDDPSKNYYSIAHNPNFTGVNNATITTRLSIVGRFFDKKTGVYYSKVLVTYSVMLTNTITGGVSSISMTAIKDYVNSSDTTKVEYSEYAHGVNIGFVIGHCDGSCKEVYVHNGTLSLNNGTTGFKTMAQETERGLIGEVGSSLDKDESPKYNEEAAGDTGLVNFSQMYADIAGSSEFTVDSSGKWYNYTRTATTSDKYADYLPTNLKTGSALYNVSIADGAVDFLGRQWIKDSTGENGDRHLGVFSLVTGTADPVGYTNPADPLGSFTIYDQTNAFSDFYYTTAEWKNDSSLSQYVTRWGYSGGGNNHLNLAGYMPDQARPYQWNASFERHFNFIIHSSLASQSALHDYNYFENTTNGFFKSYLSYKLVDKTGAPIETTSKKFGLAIKNVASDGTISNIESFNASLKMSAPTRNDQDNQDNDMIPITSVSGTSLPARTVNFSVKSAWANVTVMAGSRNGCGGYVGVYDADRSLTSSFNVAGAYANQRPAYAMYVPYTANQDQFAYFNYDYSKGPNNTGFENVENTDQFATVVAGGGGDKLFAHTFKLPTGNYFIASPSSDTYLYYVAAQGQESSGNYGNEVSKYSPNNQIADVDFLSKGKNDTDFSLALDRCNFDFAANWDATAASTAGVNDLVISATRNGTTADSKLTSLVFGANTINVLGLNEKGYPVSFNGGTAMTKKYPSYTRS